MKSASAELATSRHKTYCAASRFARVSVSGLPRGALKTIDQAVNTGEYRSRSDFICRAIRAALSGATTL